MTVLVLFSNFEWGLATGFTLGTVVSMLMFCLFLFIRGKR